MVILSSTTDTKTSEHYVFNKVHFSNWDKACDFVKTWIIPELKQNLGLSEFIQNGNIDTGIYTNGGRNFRMVGCSKFGQDRPLKIISNHTEKDSFITCIPHNSVLINFKPKHAEARIQRPIIQHSVERIEELEQLFLDNIQLCQEDAEDYTLWIKMGIRLKKGKMLI